MNTLHIDVVQGSRHIHPQHAVGTFQCLPNAGTFSNKHELNGQVLPHGYHRKGMQMMCYVQQTLSRDPSLWVFNDRSLSFNSRRSVANHQGRTDGDWFSPGVSRPQASPCPSAAAGGSGTLSSRPRVAQPSACPEHASRIQRAKTAWLRFPEEGIWGTRQGPERRQANLHPHSIPFSCSIHGTLTFQNPNQDSM